MSLASAYSRLVGESIVVRADEPMSRHTTFRIGGPADLFLECDDVEALALVTRVLEAEGIEWMVLGKGSNLLVSDAGIRGAVITLGPGFRRFRTEGSAIVAGAGAILARLVQEAFTTGLSGLEFAVGVPGTLGGALRMNAGTRDEWIGERVASVTFFVPGVGLTSVHGDEIEWGYRHTRFPVFGVMVEATLALEPGDKDATRAAMEANLERRKRTQPLGLPNAGSVFVNPDGDSAGRLIEAAGLKGMRVGGALISDVHANFIVNTGDATAADVLALIDRVREVVLQAHGIELTPEIRVIGA